MPITTAELDAIRQVRIPELLRLEKRTLLRLQLEASCASLLACEARIVRAEGGVIRVLRLALSTGASLLVTVGGRVPAPDRESALHLHVQDLALAEGILCCIGATRWLTHPALTIEDLNRVAARACQSWNLPLNLTPQLLNAAGEVTRPGLRTPQIGALHALAAHWTISSNTPALVILPTGTGKTEVMLAATYMCRPTRLLVLVPSDALRQQTAEKFRRFGVLPGAKVIPPDCARPIVGTLTRAPATEEQRRELECANVVVSTVAMIQSLTEENLRALLACFDTVFFDEAHHVPASSWKRIHDKLDACRVVGFTATPFRLDGERVPGKVIYQFPLRLAQEQGYFQAIDFVAVDESETLEADRKIAALAIDRLRADRAAGHEHLLLARAATKTRADFLFRELYSVLAPDLSPVVIYSGLAGKNAIARAIREGRHQIVVCVDMFGEGFDLPALKIAAMHDIHRSLAITLQFTGRFTRSDARYGAATLIANVGDQRVHEAIEELYAEDADWNCLIPTLSAQANLAHLQLGEFIDQMRAQGPDHGAFDLAMLRPKTSTVIYQVGQFFPFRYRKGLHANTKVHKSWISQDRRLCVFITRSALPIEWAHIKEVTDEAWDLTILLHDPDRGLLFLHSSQTGSLHGALARAVSGDTATLIRGERMFRALSGFSRLVFHNVGLYGRGKLRFRMFTGYDVSEAISPTTQAGGVKSNVFGVGYENGRHGSIGVSFKGRLWSMSSSTIPEWSNWCGAIATKVLDEQIPTEGFLAHTLIPREITAFPDSPILSVLVPDEWIADPEAFRIVAGLEAHTILTVGIDSWQRQDAGVLVSVGLGTLQVVTFEFRWMEDQLQVRQLDGNPVAIDGGSGAIPLARHFEENPPIFMLADGSEVRGTSLLAHPPQLQLLFDINQIRTLDWAGVQLQVESKWHHGQRRAASVQGRLIDDLIRAENAFVIDDDDPGEAADVVEIIQGQHELLVRLYHCKFSGGEAPGVRMSDLYVVCGQAIRSSRLVNDPEMLFTHLEKRETAARRGGRPTRFEKGGLVELRKLRRRIERYRCRFEVLIVQPGLSRRALTPEASTVLAAADSYIREFTGAPLAVFASE